MSKASRTKIKERAMCKASVIGVTSAIEALVVYASQDSLQKCLTELLQLKQTLQNCIDKANGEPYTKEYDFWEKTNA